MFAVSWTKKWNLSVLWYTIQITKTISIIFYLHINKWKWRTTIPNLNDSPPPPLNIHHKKISSIQWIDDGQSVSKKQNIRDAIYKREQKYRCNLKCILVWKYGKCLVIRKELYKNGESNVFPQNSCKSVPLNNPRRTWAFRDSLTTFLGSAMKLYYRFFIWTHKKIIIHAS